MTGWRALACLPFLLFTATSAHASLITLEIVGGTVIDFSEFDGGSLFTAGPLQIGTPVGEDIIYTADSEFSVLGSDFFNLVDNGFWEGGVFDPNRNGFTGTFTDPGSGITFAFNDGPVQSVGGFMNYTVFPGLSQEVTIQALGSDLTVLESYVISTVAPISTSLPNDGAFRGISRGTADIFGFRYSGFGATLDDLRFSRGDTPTIPEPATLTLLAIGLALVARSLRKRSARPRA